MGRFEALMKVKMLKSDVTREDVTFTIREDGEKVGDLEVSRGAIVWYGNRDRVGRKMRWRKFDAIMQEHGYRRERRKKR